MPLNNAPRQRDASTSDASLPTNGRSINFRDLQMNLCSSYAKFSELALNQPTPPKPKPNGYVLKLYQKARQNGQTARQGDKGGPTLR